MSAQTPTDKEYLAAASLFFHMKFIEATQPDLVEEAYRYMGLEVRTTCKEILTEDSTWKNLLDKAISVVKETK